MSEGAEDKAKLFEEEAEVVDLGSYRIEDWLSVVIFWILGAVVFYQFFTRYVLNDSASWTEEIARYLLIGVVFVGAAIGVRRNNHIHVDLLYHYVSRRVGRMLSLMVDLLRIAFLVAACVLSFQLIDRIGSSRMAVVDLPMGWVYGVVLLGFVLMAWRAVRLAVQNWRTGRSTLQDQEIEA